MLAVWACLTGIGALVGAVEAVRLTRDRRQRLKEQATTEHDQRRTAVLKLMGSSYVRGAIAATQARMPVALPGDVDAVRDILDAAGVRLGAIVAGDGGRVTVVRSCDVRWDDKAEGVSIEVGVETRDV